MTGLGPGLVTDGVQVRFQLLGPVRAWSRGPAGAAAAEAEIDLGPGKQRAVLAVLLLGEGAAVPTSRILDAVWGDDPPANGLNVVQKYVAGLRRALEPARSPRAQSQVLTLTEAGYLLAVDARAVDTELFDATVTAAVAALRAAQPDDAASLARDALGLWHGEPLAGLAGSWFAARRARLLDGRGLALETWATAELELGHHERLTPELRRLVDEFPLRERLRELLMLALYRSGRRAEALAVFRDTREFLVDEIGAEPGAGLQDLFGRMLRSDPALDAPPAPGVRVPPAHEPGAPPSAPYRAPEPGAPPLPGGGPPPGPPAAGQSGGREHSFVRRLLRHLGAAVAILGPIASLGMLTWAFVAFFAIRRRSVALGVASVVYLALTIAMLILVGPEDADLPLWRDWVIGILFLLTMGGGAVHLAAVVHGRRAAP
jgi:DNA-binding SARP family transcriptional activator